MFALQQDNTVDTKAQTNSWWKAMILSTRSSLSAALPCRQQRAAGNCSTGPGLCLVLTGTMGDAVHQGMDSLITSSIALQRE
ncbi:hypothetical protein EYF80_011814 [Liparis tanakae]|uniref:Uncharacterized protein n=1 Tax=Liparis tanakae TaxID=230148 RepID=A0A4Z2IJ62_9TELE|nr:hypothetical protein EYF80_011814 [Liparis tanakae]